MHRGRAARGARARDPERREATQHEEHADEAELFARLRRATTAAEVRERLPGLRFLFASGYSLNGVHTAGTQAWVVGDGGQRLEGRVVVTAGAVHDATEP